MYSGLENWHRPWLDLDQGLRWIERLLVSALTLLVLAIGLLQLGGSVLERELPWELNSTVQAAILWMVMLSASLATDAAGHWQPRRFDQRPAHRLRRTLRRLALLVAAGVSMVLAAASLRYLALDLQLGSAGPLGLPGWVQRIALPAGFFVIGLRLMAQAVFASSDDGPGQGGAGKRGS